MTVLVIGGGFAGVAAAWALSRRGRQVILAWDGAGASSLYPGVLDRQDWDGPPDPRPVAREVEEFLQVLDCWAPSSGAGARLATSSGVLRPARVFDRALLDLEPLRGQRVDVMDVPRRGWDAADLARAWSASSWARQTRTEFRAVPVEVPDGPSLRFLPEGELAARADDPSWAAALGEALRSAGDGQAPLLCGPWLGLLPGSAQRVREAARRPLGEVLSMPGGPAGFRFEAARDAWLARTEIQVQRASVEQVTLGAQGFEVLLSSDGSGATGSQRLEALPTEVILATGGVAGGGVRFLSGNGAESRTFSLSLAVSVHGSPLSLRLRGREVSLESGLLGADLQGLGRAALEQVGVLSDELQGTALPGVYVAGDLVADRPRAALEAISSAIVAARAACRVNVSQIPLSNSPQSSSPPSERR
jgi:glycerol-3-phosphate dehydrogenase subunit B